MSLRKLGWALYLSTTKFYLAINVASSIHCAIILIFHPYPYPDYGAYRTRVHLFTETTISRHPFCTFFTLMLSMVDRLRKQCSNTNSTPIFNSCKISHLTRDYLFVEVMTALDGRVASLAGNQQYIVTSPNTDWVPLVSFNRAEVRLMVDWRFGSDDASLWPQWYKRDYPFLCAIPLMPTCSTDELSVLWWRPARRDFEQSVGMAEGVGQLRRDGDSMSKLRRLREKIKKETEEMNRDFSTKMLPPSLMFNATHVGHTWIALTTTYATFEETCLELSEYQRSWLELRATLDLANWLRQVYDHRAEEVGIPPTKPVMGAFVDTPGDAQILCAAGIPVWLVRKAEDVLGRGFHIDKIVSPSNPRDRVVLKPHADFQPIYLGSPLHNQHYTSQVDFSRLRITCRVDGVEMDAGVYNDSGEMASKPVAMAELAMKPTVRGTSGPIRAVGSIQKRVAPCEFPSFGRSPYNTLTPCPSLQTPLQKIRSKQPPLHPPSDPSPRHTRLTRGRRLLRQHPLRSQRRRSEPKHFLYPRLTFYSIPAPMNGSSLYSNTGYNHVQHGSTAPVSTTSQRRFPRKSGGPSCSKGVAEV